MSSVEAGTALRRLRNGELVHFFVIALLQIDNFTLGGRDPDRREAIVVACASVRPFRKPGADTVRQIPGFFVRYPAIAAAYPAFCSCWKDNTRIPKACAIPKSVIGIPGTVDRLEAVELQCIGQVEPIGQVLGFIRIGTPSAIVLPCFNLFRRQSVQIVNMFAYVPCQAHRVLAHQGLRETGVACSSLGILCDR